MSALFEPGAVYRALQEVQEGADPADVYARLMGESVDPEEAIENDFHDHLGYAHDFPVCRDKHATNGTCFGFTCQAVGEVRIMTDCPCTCHKEEEL